MHPDGATDSILLRYQLDEPGLLHYAVLDARAPPPRDARALRDTEVGAQGDHVRAKGTLHVSHARALETAKVAGLGPGASLGVYFATETAGSGGVLGSVYGPVAVATHASAPALLQAALTPLDAHVDALSLSYQLDAPGLLHALM